MHGLTATATQSTDLRVARSLTLVFVLAGIVIRWVGLDWDDGHLFHPDERNIALAAASLFRDGRMIPDFFAYNGLAIYLPRFLAEIWTAVGGHDGVVDAAATSLAARWLSACYASVAVLVLAAIGGALAGPWGKAMAAAFAAFDVGLIQAAHFGTTESALTLTVALLIWLSVRLLLGQTSYRRFAMLSAAILAFGLAQKTSALSFSAIPACATLLVARQVPKREIARGILSAAALGASLLPILTPNSFIAWRRFLATMEFEGGIVTGARRVFWTLQFEDTIPGLFQLEQLFLLSGPLVPILAAVALLMLARPAPDTRRAARLLAPMLLFAVLYGAIILTWHAKFIRYLLPLTPVLLLLAAWSASRFLAQGTRAGRAMPIFASAATITYGLWFSTIYLAADPRNQASDYLAGHAASDDLVLIEERDVPPVPPAGIRTAFLPILSVDDGQARRDAGQNLASADWILVATRRNSGVLPRVDGYDLACRLYVALAEGRLGYEAEMDFNRAPVILPGWLPTHFGEETLTVFDHPRVRLYRNRARLAPGAIATALADTDLAPCRALTIGADILDIAAPPGRAAR